MLEILKGQAKNADRQRLGQVATMLNVELETSLLKLGLYIPAGRTVLTVNWGLDHHAGRCFAGHLRDFHVNVAVAGIHAGILQKSLSNMNQL